MKKSIFESLKFFCAAFLCVILSAFATPAHADNSCRNLFDPSTAELGDISSETGVISSSVQYRIVSGFIPVTPGETYTASGKIYNTGAGLHDVMIIRAYYDSGQRFIADSRTMSDATFTIPSGVSYVRVEYWTGENGTAVIAQSQLQFEQGSTATAYTPYNPLCATCDGTIGNYTSATGTVSQSGTPTPDNPIEPTFYKQGNMILRKVGDYADSYDATTGKITRRVGVKVLDGTESWSYYSVQQGNMFRISIAGGVLNDKGVLGVLCNSYEVVVSGSRANDTLSGTTKNYDFINNNYTTLEDWKAYIAQQYAAGTPVTVWYPLETETTEDWTETSYCETPIKIATTKYNESAFGPLNTALANAISVVDSVVSNTITQAASIATLQAQKQTRPANDTCPAYKQCLLVEDEQGVPHWYEITDPFRDFVAPIIANNVAPASTTNSVGYTQLEYIESDGNSLIDTGIVFNEGALKFKANIMFRSNGGVEQELIGNYIAANRASFVAGIYSTNKVFVYGNGGNVNTEAVLNEWQTFIGEGDSSGNVTMIYNNQTKIATRKSFYNDTNIVLFAGGSGMFNPAKSAIRLNKIALWRNDTLVRDFVPVKRNSDGAIGMYDTVTKTFFANAGTGTFTAGPVVANTDVPANGMWTATWAADATTGVTAGTITGEGLCNGVTGTESTAATSTQTSSANWSVDGANCWCKTTAIDDGDDTTIVDGVWVFYYARSSAADCALNCAYACAARVRDNASFRSALFGD